MTASAPGPAAPAAHAAPAPAAPATPWVSVILPVLNGVQTVGATLTALMPQCQARPGVEVLVADNGSTDGTAELVQRFPVTLLREPRRGISAARNRALRQARAPIIACLDADTLPSRRWLAEITRPLADPRVVLVAGGVTSFQPRTVSERYAEATGLFEPRNHALAPVFPFAIGMNLAVRRAAALAVGGWSVDFPSGEDVDFSQRILRAYPGSLVYHAPAVVFHRNRPTLSGLARQAEGYGRGVARVYQRYPEQAGWGPGKAARVLATVVGRGLGAAGQGLLALARPGRRPGAQMAACHALWTWCFWRGFAGQYYLGQAPPPIDALPDATGQGAGAPVHGGAAATESAGSPQPGHAP